MEMGESQSGQTEQKLHVKEAVMTREAITLAQIHQLLSIAGTMAGVATRHTIEDEDGAVSMTEAQIAAENTFINACEALDKILADPLRWDLSFQQQQEKVFQATQAAALEHKLNRIRNEDAPHVRFPPSLYRTLDGRWMALLGNPDTPGSGVTGIGDCPEEALKNFDAAFTGRAVTIDPVKWADELFKNEQQKLDTSGTGHDSGNAVDGSLLGRSGEGSPGPEPGWLPDNLGEDQGRDSNDDGGANGADGAGKPA